MAISLLIVMCGVIICALAFVIYNQTAIDTMEIKDGSIPLDKVFPIQEIEENYLINGNGDITAGYEILLPEVFTFNELEKKQFFSDMESLCRMLPSGTVIHQHVNFYTSQYENQNIGEVNNYIQKENLLYYQGRSILHASCFFYFTFTDQGKKDARKTQSSLLQKKNYLFTQPYKNYQTRLNEIEGYIINLEDGLKNMKNISFRRMENQTLADRLFDDINCSYDTPAKDCNLHNVSPISVSDKGEMKIGENYVAVISLVEEGAILYPYNKRPKVTNSQFSDIKMPENIDAECSMIFPLGLGLPFAHQLNIVVEILENDKTMTQLSSEGRSLNPLVQFYPPAREKKNQLEMFIDTVTKGNYQTAYTAINVIIKDPDHKMLQKKVSQAKNAFLNMNHSTGYVENAETANIFFCSLPGNARSNYRGFVNTTAQALSYFMKDSLYMSDKEGYVFLDRFGNPCVVDLWNSEHLVNKNRILIGPSGEGKSYWLNNYILQSATMGHDVIIIDIGGSYKSMIALNHGKYYDSREKSTFSFNPFLCCTKDKYGKYIYYVQDDPEAKDDVIQFISTILSVIWKPVGKGGKDDVLITGIEEAILRKTIRLYYDYVNSNNLFPTTIGYRDFLENTIELNDKESSKFDKNELILMLEPYTSGELSFLLNSNNNLDIVNDSLIAFDMEAAKGSDYFSVVIVIVLNLIADKIKFREGIVKKLIIDEGFDFLQDPKMGGFIGYLYRTFRKKEGEVLLAAQDCKFIQNCPANIKDSILTNSDTKILLNHSNAQNSFNDLKNVLSITDDELVLVKSLQKTSTYREFYMKLGKVSSVFRNEVSPISDVAFDSRQSTVVAIKKLFETCGSTQGAIQQYLENQRKGIRP